MGHRRRKPIEQRQKLGFYYYYVISTRATETPVKLLMQRHRNNKDFIEDKYQYYKQLVYSSSTKPSIAPELQDPFTVREGHLVCFKMEDEKWIATITRLMLTK